MSTSRHFTKDQDEVHASESADHVALCGTPPDGKRWTKKKREVTCSQCLDQVCRLQAKPKAAFRR